MKFRAVINQPAAMRELHGIIAMLAKIHKEATLVLEPTQIHFVLAENVVQGTPWLWSDIDTGDFFAEYTMHGVDRLLHDRIVMSVNTVKLAGALAQLHQRSQQVRFVKLKLTNRQFPCLTIELEVPSAAGGAAVPYRRVTHDVPVTLIAVRDWSEFEVPRLRRRRRRLQINDDGTTGTTHSDGVSCTDSGRVSGSIGMPSVRSLRTLVDRIKNLSPSITVYYNNAGELSLVVETDQATVSSHYINLQVVPDDDHNAGSGHSADLGGVADDAVAVGANNEVSCSVSSKQLAMVLSSLQMSTAMWCHIERDQALSLRVEIRPSVTVNCMLNVVEVAAI